MSNKRLYKTSEGAMLFGVCKGVAEFFNIDVTIVRLLWVILAFTSIGFWIYIACYFIFPDKATVEREKRQMTKEAVFETHDYKVKEESEKKKDQDYTIY